MPNRNFTKALSRPCSYAGAQPQETLRVKSWTGAGRRPFPTVVAWSRILDSIEAVCVVNPNGDGFRGGDILVDSAISPRGTVFEVVANTAQAAAGEGYGGSHPVGEKNTVTGQSGEPGFLAIRDIPPCEVLVLVKRLEEEATFPELPLMR